MFWDKEGEEEVPLEEIIFDCPTCALPAEVVAILTHVNGHRVTNYYVISCLGGDHDADAVTEDWFMENIRGIV